MCYVNACSQCHHSNLTCTFLCYIVSFSSICTMPHLPVFYRQSIRWHNLCWPLCADELNLPSLPSLPPPPVVYSTDRSKAVVLVLFLLFVALCSFVVPVLLSVFSICVVRLELWSPSSIAAHFAFFFTSCVVMLAFWSPSTVAHLTS